MKRKKESGIRGGAFSINLVNDKRHAFAQETSIFVF